MLATKTDKIHFHMDIFQNAPLGRGKQKKYSFKDKLSSAETENIWQISGKLPK